MLVTKDQMSFGEALARLEPGRRPAGHDLESEGKLPKTAWDLGIGFDRAVELARDGWSEKREEIQRYFSEVQRLVENRFDVHLDVAGEAVDIGAYLEGEPECMLNFVAPELRTVKLVLNLSASCGTDARVLMNRGIAVAALVYALQSSGVGVSLYVAEWVRGSDGSQHETLIQVNDYGEYIDAGKLAFWIGHPATLRRCIFRYNEQQSSQIRERFGFYEGGGYGRPVDPTGSELMKDGTIFFPYPEFGTANEYESPEKAFQAIRKIAAAQGVTLELKA